MAGRPFACAQSRDATVSCLNRGQASPYVTRSPE
jgi:hypothetical protein